MIEKPSCVSWKLRVRLHSLLMSRLRSRERRYGVFFRLDVRVFDRIYGKTFDYRDRSGGNAERRAPTDRAIFALRGGKIQKVFSVFRGRGWRPPHAPKQRLRNYLNGKGVPLSTKVRMRNLFLRGNLTVSGHSEHQFRLIERNLSESGREFPYGKRWQDVDGNV